MTAKTYPITVDHYNRRSTGRLEHGQYGNTAVHVLNGHASVETPNGGLNCYNATDLRALAALLVEAAEIIEGTRQAEDPRTKDYNRDVACSVCGQTHRADKLFRCGGKWVDLNGKVIA